MANLIGTDGTPSEGWQRLEGSLDPDTLPQGALLLPLDAWLANGERLREQREQPLGVWLATDDLAESLEGRLEGLSLIAVHFPVFSDGRGYSNARILRERLGWDGELRAIGDVLPDQIFAMRRCGFDSFEVRADRSATDAVSALASFHHVYQHATRDPATPLLQRR